ncbi:UNVERIFIED_CONTAM: hypothetical protein FKN15_013738 [Acipenser sinensis]
MERVKQATMSKADKKGGKGVPDVVQKVATFSLNQSQKIWENVSHSCLSNVQKDIAWNTVHSSLPTRAFMFRRGLAQVETCPYAKFADTAKMTAETVLYGPAGGIATSTAKCVWRVINVIKQILWEGRNICVYHKQELDTITTTRRAQTLIKDFVILDIRTREGQGLRGLEDRWTSGREDRIKQKTGTASS